MKIYTKTGDGGETGLFGGARVSKACDRVDAYGELDELNAALGVCRAHGLPADIDAVVASVQVDLFVVGAELATAPGREASLHIALLDDAAVSRLESAIDASEASLPPLKSFVLPGGTPASASLHLARTVARRAERRLVALTAQEPLRPVVLIYLNRLSDLLFSLARRANLLAGVDDVPWSPRGA